MRRLLDTNAFSAYRRGHPGAMEMVRSAETIDFSIIVIGELLFGYHKGDRTRNNLAQLDEFLAHPRVTVAFLTRATADRFGRISAALRVAGTPIPTNDIWIAAQAQELGAELITFDRHFERVAGLVLTFPDA